MFLAPGFNSEAGSRRLYFTLNVKPPLGGLYYLKVFEFSLSSPCIVWPPAQRWFSDLFLRTAGIELVDRVHSLPLAKQLDKTQASPASVETLRFRLVSRRGQPKTLGRKPGRSATEPVRVARSKYLMFLKS